MKKNKQEGLKSKKINKFTLPKTRPNQTLIFICFDIHMPFLCFYGKSLKNKNKDKIKRYIN